MEKQCNVCKKNFPEEEFKTKWNSRGCCGVCDRKKRRERAAVRYKKNHKEFNNRSVTNYRKFSVDYKIKQKKYRERNRKKVLEYYGGIPPKCFCCGEKIEQFLTIDHLNNKGSLERKNVGGGGHHNYRTIIKNNFPKGYQVLCYNCNCGRGKRNQNFICPHKLGTVTLVNV